jgi:agmatinase
VIHVLGVPLDENSSFLRGPARAPAKIRAVLSSGAMNLTSEDGTDLEQSTDWRFAGDLELPEGSSVERLEAVQRGVGEVLARGEGVLALGGDHSISWPLVAAHAAVHGPLTVLHLDAHPDLYDVLDGNPYSHACPFARIMERGLAGRLVQVGVRTLNAHQRIQAERFGVEIVQMREFSSDLRFKLEGPVYLSLDLDVLDPAFAPGVSHHEPGGISVRELLGVLHGLEGRIVGADIVEYNPTRDVHDMTAAVGAKLVKEVLALMLRAWS